MRIAFAGTPEFAAQALEALITAGHTIPLVLTQPDRPAGRGLKLQASAVKAVALRHGLPVYQPERLKDPATHEPIRAADIDVMVVAAYGLILPQAVLDIPRRGCLNIHASLLPRWRGAAPIHRAIEAGDMETGITIMQMDAGLDTGAMLLKESTSIEPSETTGELHDRLAALGARMIVDALARLDKLSPQPQPAEGIIYAHKIGKQEAHLDWNAPAAELERKVRAFNPFPGAAFDLSGQTIKVWRAEALSDCPGDLLPGAVLARSEHWLDVVCKQGALRLLELQSPGGRRMTCRDFLLGNPHFPG